MVVQIFDRWIAEGRGSPLERHGRCLSIRPRRRNLRDRTAGPPTYPQASWPMQRQIPRRRRRRQNGHTSACALSSSPPHRSRRYSQVARDRGRGWQWLMIVECTCDVPWSRIWHGGAAPSGVILRQRTRPRNGAWYGNAQSASTRRSARSRARGPRARRRGSRRCPAGGREWYAFLLTENGIP